MPKWKDISPGGAVADFRTVFRDAGRYRWLFVLAAASVTFGIFFLMSQQEGRGPPRPNKVVFFESWRADRSAAVTRKHIAEVQKQTDAQAAEEARRAEDVKGMYKTLGRMSGMDVDAIERQANVERAAEAAARAAAGMGAGPIADTGAQVPVASPS